MTTYLDNAATTPMLPEVVETLREAASQNFANPASQHGEGRRARGVLEAARERMAGMLGLAIQQTAADRLILTSGGSESNNLAIFGLAGESPGQVIISPIEHPSVAAPAEVLRRRGWKIDCLRVDGRGVVDLADFERLLSAETRLVSVMLGNNETGVVQPVPEIAHMCRAIGVPVHTDATQAVGKIRVDFRELGVDALTFAAHKFHGPRGIGALIVRAGVALQPLLQGGFQQGGLRPGTESVELAVGMCRALELWHEDAAGRYDHLLGLRNDLEKKLRRGWPGLVVPSQDAERLPHILSVAFPGLDRQTLVMALDVAGVCCSTGSACASGSSEPSPVLLAMGLDDAVVEGALRLSVGAQNTAAEIDAAVDRIMKTVNDLWRRKTSGK